MKKYALVFYKCALMLGLCFSVVNSYGQTDKKNLVGIHSALGTGTYGDYSGRVGGGSYDIKSYYSIGLDYLRILSKRFSLSSGFEYTYSDMTVSPAPGIGGTPIKHNLKLTTIPVQLKYNFWKCLYVNGGLFFNLSARTSEEWWIQKSKPITTSIIDEEGLIHLHTEGGEYVPTHKLDMLLGWGLGIGIEHEFSSGLTLFLNPYFRVNGIENAKTTRSFLRFLKQGNLDGYQFLQSGVSLGIGYKF